MTPRNAPGAHRVTRAAVLAHRAAAHGLHRTADDAAGLAVWDTGVQGPAGNAALALAARTREPAPAQDLFEDGSRALLWSVRGAPHVHPLTALPGLTAALWPLSDADAETRLGTSGKTMRKAGVPGLEAFRMCAQALRDAVPEPTAKGDVSTAVTKALPDALAYDCATCKTRHVYGSLLQLAAIGADVALDPDARGTVLTPRPGTSGGKGKPGGGGAPGGRGDGAAVAGLIRGYLRLHGPAGLDEAAAFLGTRRPMIADAWPTGLTEVSVEGRTAWLAEPDLDALHRAAPLDGVRLLPPGDPYLQARDRELILPDPDRRKALWKSVGSPGAVLADGEITGTWRVKGTGRRADVTVTLFDGAPAAALRRAVEDEAERVAAVRGAAEARTAFTGG